MTSPLSPEEWAEIERITAGYHPRDNVMAISEAIALHFKAAGRAAAIEECEKVCARRSHGRRDDDPVQDGVRAAVTAVNALSTLDAAFSDSARKRAET